MLRRIGIGFWCIFPKQQFAHLGRLSSAKRTGSKVEQVASTGVPSFCSIPNIGTFLPKSFVYLPDFNTFLKNKNSRSLYERHVICGKIDQEKYPNVPQDTLPGFAPVKDQELQNTLIFPSHEEFRTVASKHTP